MTDRDLCKVIRANFSLSPGSILRDLDLLKPKYYETARYGHFGRSGHPEFTWETPKPLNLDCLK